MIEEAFYIGSDNTIFSMLFRPQKDVCKSIGFVVVHPFAEEKKSAHRTLVDLSRELCRYGYPVLMFDLEGCGDSKGDFGSIRLTDWLSNLNTVIHLFKSKTQLLNVGIIGLRMGTYLCLNYAKDYVSLPFFICIEPIIYPTDYLKKSLRQKLFKELCTDGKISSKRDVLIQKLQEDTSIDFDGWNLGARLYQDLAISQSENEIENYLNCISTTLMVSISINERRSKDIRKIMLLNRNEVECIDIKMEPFWSKINEVDNKELIQQIVFYVNNWYERNSI